MSLHGSVMSLHSSVMTFSQFIYDFLTVQFLLSHSSVMTFSQISYAFYQPKRLELVMSSATTAGAVYYGQEQPFFLIM